MRPEKIIEERREWYNFIPALFEIVKVLKNRELAIISDKTIPKEIKKAFRYLLAFNINYLKKHFKWSNFLKSRLNLYHSVAKLTNVPIFSYDVKKRQGEEAYKKFNKNYDEYVIGYNIFMDIDSGDRGWKQALSELKEIKEIFDDFKVPYYILNSSGNGFHIIIPQKYVPEENYKYIKEMIKELNDFLFFFKNVEMFECIDETVIDLKRICKVPYSYVCDGHIALPLSDKQIENFTPEMVEMSNILKNIKIKNRGLLVRKHNLSEEELKKNVEKMIMFYTNKI